MNTNDNKYDEQIWTTPNQRKLIAAAPELLKTLKRAEIVLRYLNFDGEHDNGSFPVKQVQDEIRAAIAKATEG